MENGFKNWPIVRKLLIDNRLQHSALLAYSIGVGEGTFMMRARHAYRLMESRIDDAVEIASDTLNTVANAVQAEEERTAQAKPAEQAPPEAGVRIDVSRVVEGTEPLKPDEP
jgi:hypothetical protein